MAISMFDGEEDAYWWVLCTEKHFKELGTPEEAKVPTAVTKLRGRPLYWWRWWSHYHPEPSWDAFTTVFLGRFKPEWWHLLPISDEKEEPDWQSPLLTMQGDNDAQGPTRVEDEITVPALGDLQKEEENPKEDGFGGRSNDTSQSGGDGNESRPLKNPAKPVPLSKSSARKFYVAATGIPVAGGLTIPPPPPKLPNAKLHGDGHVLLPVESTRVRTAVDTPIPDTEPYDPGPLTSIFPTTRATQLYCSPSPPTLVFSPASMVTISCDCLIFQLSHNILVGNPSPSTLKSEILFDSNVLPMLPNDPNRDKPVVASVFSFILAAGAAVIPILNEGGFSGCGIWKSIESTTMRTFPDTYRVFDAMTLSGNCYFSLTNGPLQFKVWDPGANTTPMSGFAISGQAKIDTLSIFLFVPVAVLHFYTLKKLILDVGSPPQVVSGTDPIPTRVGHIVFEFASSGASWFPWKEYAKLWWNLKSNKSMKRCVSLDSLPDHSDGSIPPLCVSEDPSQLLYTYRLGSFAISSSWVKVLATVFYSCMQSYSHINRSEAWAYFRITEYDVGLINVSSFHQVDLRGIIFGLLAALPWQQSQASHIIVKFSIGSGAAMADKVGIVAVLPCKTPFYGASRGHIGDHGFLYFSKGVYQPYATILPILISWYSLNEYDAAATITEDIEGAVRNGPLAILGSLGIVFGW